MTHPPLLADRVAGIVRSALAALARLGPTGVLSGPVLVAIWTSIQRRLLRFQRLMARVAAEQAPASPRPASPGAARPAQERAPRAGRRASLVPRGYAWAVLLAQETASFGSQLQALLAEPAVAALLRQTPQAGPILRPLCRMLAVDLPEYLRPVSLRPPRPPLVPRAPRPRFPGDEHWPGVRVWRERWEATFAREYARQVAPRRPP